MFWLCCGITNVVDSPSIYPTATQYLPPPPEPTEQLMNPPTETPSLKTYNEKWTIKTGDLEQFVADQNGAIYGIGDDLLAIIGEDGNVVETFSLDLSNCTNSSANNMADVITLIPDGRIISSGSSSGEKPCAIKLGDPPTLEYFDRSMRLAPYTEEGITTSEKPIPEGYSASTSGSGSRGSYFNNFYYSHFPRNSGGASDLYINEAVNKVGFWGVDGNFIDYDFPESLEILSEVKVDFLITPWNDLYYRHEEFDQLGNKLGYKYIRLRENQTPRQIDDWPSDLFQDAISYNPSQNILFVLRNLFMIMNQDFTVLEYYQIPQEIQRNRHNLGIFVGEDHALYVYDRKEETLSKFSK